MAVTFTTNYVGDVIRDIYKVFGVGNEVIANGDARLETGIKVSRFLPYITLADNPVGAYETTPTGETADTDYAERTLTMVKAMLYEVIDPVVWNAIWDEFASAGMTFTQLNLNAEIFSAVFELYADKVGEQFSDLFWSGNTGTGGLINGIVTLAAADVNVTDIANIGAITKSNVYEVLTKIYEGIPTRLLKRPDFKIYMSNTDLRKLELADLDAKKGTIGILGNESQMMLLRKKIVGYEGIPENSIICAEGGQGLSSNLVFGFYATPDEELGEPIIDKTANNARSMFIRVDWKLGAQYRWGGDIVLYQGS